MPELPDVEGFRAVAENVAVGHRVSAVTVTDDRVLRTTTPQGLGDELADEVCWQVEVHPTIAGRTTWWCPEDQPEP